MKVGYIFYKKRVSSNLVIPFRSAQPMNGKIASLSQDVYRIMSNCEKNTARETVIACLEDFCTRLRDSSYPVIQ